MRIWGHIWQICPHIWTVFDDILTIYGPLYDTHSDILELRKNLNDVRLLNLKFFDQNCFQYLLMFFLYPGSEALRSGREGIQGQI